MRARVHDETRVAVVAPRSVGSAVERNRAKRRIRAALRVVTLPPHEHIAILATKGVRSMPFDELVERLRSGLEEKEDANA